jgi:hypothetical protein
MQAATIFSPGDILDPRNNNTPSLSEFKYRLLAQGDSWFSIGALNIAKNSNLLHEMEYPDNRCIINCARTGSTLRRMVDQMQEPNFANLLCGNQRVPWHGIIISAGGNDMIDAIGHKDIQNPALRLFLLPSERTGDPADCETYLSPAGWVTFETHIRAMFAELVRMRDLKTPNRGIPIFLHTYHFPTIRNAPAGLTFGPWLFKATQSFEIPVNVWPTLSRRLFNRFGDLLSSIALAHTNFHVFDSANLVAVTPALPNTAGESGDWINEIHLTWQGYEKIALAWARDIQFTLP